MYTLIAYRSNGCYYDSTSDSDFKIHYCVDKEELLEKASYYMVFDHFSDQEYCGYELTYLLDGTEWSWVDSPSAEKEYYDFQKQLIKLTEQKLELKRLELEAKEKADREKAEAKRKQRLLQELERIQNELTRINTE